MVALEGGADGCVELIERLGAFEGAFDAYGAGVSALKYIEIHGLFYLPTGLFYIYLSPL